VINTIHSFRDFQVLVLSSWYPSALKYEFAGLPSNAEGIGRQAMREYFTT